MMKTTKTRSRKGGDPVIRTLRQTIIPAIDGVYATITQFTDFLRRDPTDEISPRDIATLEDGAKKLRLWAQKELQKRATRPDDVTIGLGMILGFARQLDRVLSLVWMDVTQAGIATPEWQAKIATAIAYLKAIVHETKYAKETARALPNSDPRAIAAVTGLRRATQTVARTTWNYIQRARAEKIVPSAELDLLHYRIVIGLGEAQEQLATAFDMIVNYNDNGVYELARAVEKVEKLLPVLRRPELRREYQLLSAAVSRAKSVKG